MVPCQTCSDKIFGFVADLGGLGVAGKLHLRGVEYKTLRPNVLLRLSLSVRATPVQHLLAVNIAVRAVLITAAYGYLLTWKKIIPADQTSTFGEILWIQIEDSEYYSNGYRLRFRDSRT